MDIIAIINMYNAEHTRRDAIVQSLSLPTGFLLGMVAAYSAMALNFNWNNSLGFDWRDYFCLIKWGFIFTSILFFLALFALFKSLVTAASGQTYKYIGNVQTWLDFKKEISDFYQRKYPTVWEEWTSTRFKELLVQKYTECTDHNFLQNNEKSFHRFQLYRRLLISISFLVICTFPFYLNYLEHPPIQKILITH